jgi:hypothetical protein
VICWLIFAVSERGRASSGCQKAASPPKTAAMFKQQDVYDTVCPRDPRELSERLSEKRFAQL